MKIAKLLNPFYVYRRGLVELEHLMSCCGLISSSNYQKLAALKDKHHGKRAFIIGNGSSLRISDLEHLKGEITFACNKIYLAFEDTEWRPTYYAAEDELFLKQSCNKINSFSGITKFFPSRTKALLPNIKEAIYFKLFCNQFYPHEPYFSSNALNGLYWGSTITYTLLQLACYMGIREIYLLGVDFDYFVPKGLEQGDKPFIVQESLNHFHPDYLKPGDYFYPPNLHRHEKAYHAAGKAISRLNGKVYNATRGGKLEIFPRIDFDTLF